MKCYRSFTILFKFLCYLLVLRSPVVSAQQSATGEKSLYLPGKVMRVPDGNDYHSNESEFSYQRMVQSPNIAIFWHREFGADPAKNADSAKRFDVNEALKECERFYGYYVNELKLVQKGNSLTDRYKMILYVIGGDEQTAFGGGVENKIGILWTPAVRMSKAPYGALAHELGHAFQYMSRSDSKAGPRGPIMEMSAQYMLWQVYPEWMTFENYHLKSYLKKTHYAFLHPQNMYHSPYVLEYWSEKHGKTFFGELCRSTQEGEDPVMTYKRLTGVSQEKFNDEMFEAAGRFMTWDLKRVAKEAARYANQHSTRLNPAKGGWWKVDSANCPQNYGYNGIALTVPASVKMVTPEFEGIAGAKGYSDYKSGHAGWRYGFVAFQKDGTRVYGKMSREAKGKLKFKVPADTQNLWLVVSGAPTEHWVVPFGRQKTVAPEEQWPYQIRLSGTSIAQTE
ncbi:DUF6055 domain-containing protein [Dyadobacter aurulentus]|uniref:DUF6055 domain-containing protein n=1 Tax=Dyadobacter sp. UC 10 TaxID=2605428 RepID=UPI001788BC2B|nr:DUF6055 domain-containing protein [Dyadobacter sp. UC 10]